MKRNGFTLVELIVVVVVIGVLATLAIPQYSKAVERAKGAKAKYAISLIRQAEELYYDDYKAYVCCSESDFIAPLSKYIELSQLSRDADWKYLMMPIGVVGANQGLRIGASRESGKYKGKSISVSTIDNTWQPSEKWPPPSPP